MTLSPSLAQEATAPGLAVRLAESGLFDQYVVYEQRDHWWFAGGALGSVTLYPDVLRLTWDGRPSVITGVGSDPFRWLGTALNALPAGDWHAYGWIAFETALAARGLPVPEPSEPLAHFVVPRAEVALSPGLVDVRCPDPTLSAEITKVIETSTPPPPPLPRPLPVNADDPSPYLDAVRTAVRRIRDGDLEKVILSRRLAVPFEVDFPATYLAARAHHTPARSFLLDLPGMRATGFSPETVAEVSPDGRVVTQPLAGTRARLPDPGEDHRNTRDLVTDPKEIYEHAVSVKLADDELRALCVPGSVSVSEFMSLKSRGSVHHLGSRVQGRLSPEHTAWDALGALFPAVTASGIPKEPAYALITALEDAPRGLYSGAVVRATRSGSLDAALVLRTVYTQHDATWLRAGAGIVATSTPSREYTETCEKLTSVAPHLVPREPHP